MKKIESKFSFDFGKQNEFYYKLLKEEDFDFKTKNININLILNKQLECILSVESVLDLKIGVNALIKSLEVIGKTLAV